jgi:hypothetical protein
MTPVLPMARATLVMRDYVLHRASFMRRVPDAVQRLFDDAPQSRDRYECRACSDPGLAAHHAAKCGVLHCIRGTPQ